MTQTEQAAPTANETGAPDSYSTIEVGLGREIVKTLDSSLTNVNRAIRAFKLDINRAEVLMKLLHDHAITISSEPATALLSEPSKASSATANAENEDTVPFGATFEFNSDFPNWRDALDAALHSANLLIWQTKGECHDAVEIKIVYDLNTNCGNGELTGRLTVPPKA